jgi:hypothetical protein
VKAGANLGHCGMAVGARGPARPRHCRLAREHRHIAVGPSGVWVIDTKRYTGRIEVAKPLFGAAKLKVAGRDQTKLVAGLAKQVALVTPVVEAVMPDARVRGVPARGGPDHQ